MVVAILGFGFCWGPTFQVELLNFYGVRSESNFVFRIWYYLAQISCSCLNPAIYAILSPEFRNLVFKSVCCRCGTRHVFNRCCRHSHANQVQPTTWVYQATCKLHQTLSTLRRRNLKTALSL